MNAAPRAVWVPSRGVRAIPHLEALLGAQVVRRHQRWDAVAGWGRKANTRAGRRAARARGLPFLALEDGFLRSVRPGVTGEPPLSIVVDDEGIYYDATKPSRLEQLIANDAFDEGTRGRARRLADVLRASGLSKYNHQPAIDLGPRDGERILIVDQTAGDQSIRRGLPSTDFAGMVRTIAGEAPDAELIVKAHPDVMLGRKEGALAEHSDRVRLLATPAHPASLFDQVDRVAVMTSQLGFEALLHGVPVTCFGVPWYAGWGLTDDRGEVPERRRRSRTLECLVASAYLAYARYVDPETGECCEAERVADHLRLQRELGEGTRGDVVCVGFSLWKRGFLPAFLDGPGTRLRFVASAERAGELEAGSRVVSWGTRDEDAVAAMAEREGAEHWRMEDGFLRSVGLGSDLHAPASLVVDRSGLYYDPASPSDLEILLAEGSFSARELERARRLRERIVDSGLSKYNPGRSRPLNVPRGRQVVLVIGQVEDDASIERGCVDVRRNAGLLAHARDARPNAFVVFRPHPDVTSGNRRGAVPPSALARHADLHAADASLAECLDRADEVHTMTSLVGFEALLREQRVVVYGHPFYAGWGLTEDRHPHPRRGRRRTLDELVAATLIRYPRYVSRVTGRYTTPEVVVDQLLEDRRRIRWLSSLVGSGRAVRQLTKGANLLRYSSIALWDELARRVGGEGAKR